MTDFQFLIRILAGMYVSECFLWVRKGSVVIRAWGMSYYTLQHPSQGLGNQRGGLVLLNPLPPLGNAFVCHQWPFSIASDGLYAYVAQTINPGARPLHTGRFVVMDEIKTISSDGRRLLINGDLFVHFADDISANHFAVLLGRIKDTPTANRKLAIMDALRKATDIPAIQQRLALYRRYTKAMRIWCHVLFVDVLLVFPLMVGWPETRRYWLSFLAVLIVALTTLIRSFYHAHRTLFPHAKVLRWKSLLAMVLTPTSSIRACDLLGRYLLVGYHPLAVAGALIERGEFQQLARRMLLDMKHPMEPACPSQSYLECETERQFRLDQFQTLVAMIQQMGIDVDELLAPPLREYPTCNSYCPRCDGQFLLFEGSCGNCGIRLHKFINQYDHSGEAIVLR